MARYSESLRAPLTRTIGIAVVAAAVVAPWSGGARRWPALFVLMLWPSFGGHWIDVWYLNWLRPRLPRARAAQGVVENWFQSQIRVRIEGHYTAERLVSALIVLAPCIAK